MKTNVKKKIIFLTEPMNSPSTRFRVLQNIPGIKDLNFDVTHEVIPKKTMERLKLFNTLTDYDIVFIQRKLFQWIVLWYISKKSKVLVFDFDDAILYKDSNESTFYSSSRLGRFKHTLKFADLTITGNEYLKELSLPYANKTIVIPTGIDTQKYTATTTYGTSPFTIGWIGSAPNLFYLKELIEPINELYKSNKNFRLKIVCDDFIDGFNCPVEKKIWRSEDESHDIQSFDIGILPVLDDIWTKGKCALKLLQYMACGLPSIASASDVTSNIINNGQNGFLASSDSEWIEILTLLLESHDKLKAIGTAARESIIGTYDTKTISSQYAEALSNITPETFLEATSK